MDGKLRSEKIRKITEHMPAGLLLWGYLTISLVLAGIVAVLIMMPYPHSGGESILRHIIENI